MLTVLFCAICLIPVCAAAMARQMPHALHAGACEGLSICGRANNDCSAALLGGRIPQPDRVVFLLSGCGRRATTSYGQRYKVSYVRRPCRRISQQDLLRNHLPAALRAVVDDPIQHFDQIVPPAPYFRASLACDSINKMLILSIHSIHSKGIH